MNRRRFLSLLGMGATGVALAPFVPATPTQPVALAFHPDAFIATFPPDYMDYLDFTHRYIKPAAAKLAADIDAQMMQRLL